MTVIDQLVKAEILNRLRNAEQEHDIKVLYACESGSRAWGFASVDSDYDVRFIYVRKEDWYLSFNIESKRDVIEYPIVDEIDCSGWDLKKALYLFTRTNGALLEWLASPIKYIEITDVADRLRELAPRAINMTALCYHYSHMARNNAREHLTKDLVKLKKYFYVLRPLFAIRYIEQTNTVPPIEFSKLMDAVAPRELVPYVNRLLELKRNATEVGVGDKIPEINQFIESELERHGQGFVGQGRPDVLNAEQVKRELNDIFRASIRGVGG